MGRKKIDINKKIFPFPVSLRREQIDWLDQHPGFQKDKFFRSKLDEYIESYIFIEQQKEEIIHETPIGN